MVIGVMKHWQTEYLTKNFIVKILLGRSDPIVEFSFYSLFLFFFPSVDFLYDVASL
uniref:Uncharacterized protein n=1 Tax=Nelumbo nucifera TaxID=4432 RepID=A0A822XLQ3_NELNU|nr:TPA_asm: hypothetical protein HUJ06_021452 [Nelumbo nucifera]